MITLLTETIKFSSGIIRRQSIVGIGKANIFNYNYLMNLLKYR